MTLCFMIQMKINLAEVETFAREELFLLQLLTPRNSMSSLHLLFLAQKLKRTNNRAVLLDKRKVVVPKSRRLPLKNKF